MARHQSITAITEQVNSICQYEAMGAPQSNYVSVAVEETTEQARQEYLRILRSPCWKEDMMNFIEDIKEVCNFFDGAQDGADAMEDEQEDIYTLYVQCNSPNNTREFSKNSCFLIGKYQQTDIVSNNNSVSRVHAAVFVTNIKVVVLDYWSLNGTRCVYRSSGKPLLISTENGRIPMVFDLDESFQLYVGSVRISFSTKACLVCMTAPRSVRFGCGHGVACESCRHRLTHCPVCRIRVNERSSRQTMCAQTYVHS